MPDPTAYLATMAGASATLVAIIGGLSVSNLSEWDAEQQMTKRQFGQAKQKADAAAHQLKLAKTRRDDRLLFDLATNHDAAGKQSGLIPWRSRYVLFGGPASCPPVSRGPAISDAAVEDRQQMRAQQWLDDEPDPTRTGSIHQTSLAVESGTSPASGRT